MHSDADLDEIIAAAWQLGKSEIVIENLTMLSYRTIKQKDKAPLIEEFNRFWEYRVPRERVPFAFENKTKFVACEQHFNTIIDRWRLVLIDDYMLPSDLVDELLSFGINKEIGGSSLYSLNPGDIDIYTSISDRLKGRLFGQLRSQIKKVDNNGKLWVQKHRSIKFELLESNNGRRRRAFRGNKARYEFHNHELLFDHMLYRYDAPTNTHVTLHQDLQALKAHTIFANDLPGPYANYSIELIMKSNNLPKNIPSHKLK